MCKELLCHPFPAIGKSEIGDVSSELNNLMLSDLRLGVILMESCKDFVGIILKFFGDFLPSFSLQSYKQNRVHEGLLLTEKQLNRGVTVLGTEFVVENVLKVLCPCSSVEGVMEGVVVLLTLECGISR